MPRDAADYDRRTYNATLAELTSLEELMRTMMADNGVHPEVVTKLWQVYSESSHVAADRLPNFKRIERGRER